MKKEYHCNINTLPKELRSKISEQREEMIKREKNKWNSLEERKKRLIKELDDIDKWMKENRSR